MAQITSGFRAIFSHPAIYNFTQRLLGAEKARAMLVNNFFPPMQGLRMLDIGCGTAEILQHLPEDMSYYGFDASEAYISEAKKHFDGRGNFHIERVSRATLDTMEAFDLVLAIGLLHHLDDDEADALFQLAAAAVKPGGVVITLDPVFTCDQSRLAKWIISKDRGQNIRTAEAYSELAEKYFEQVTVTVHHNLIHIPYSHVILECQIPKYQAGCTTALYTS